MNLLILLMYIVNMRPVYSAPIFFVLFIQIVIYSKTADQSARIKLGLKHFRSKELVVTGSLFSMSCLFVLNESWVGLTFSEKGGYEAIAPFVSLATCLFARILNGGWSFNRIEIRKGLRILGWMFGVDLLMRAISLPGFQLDYLMTEFKYGGLFPTSNVAGYLACTCLVLSKQIASRKLPLFWFTIVILTASRTSIAAALFGMVALNGIGKLRGLFTILVGVIGAAVFVYFTNINWSFESKILIIDRFFEIIQSGSIYETVFGTFGGRLEVWKKLDVSAEETLLSPHNPFVKITLYYGLIGLSCLIGFLFTGNKSIAGAYLLHCMSGIVPFLSITQFGVASSEKSSEK